MNQLKKGTIPSDLFLVQICPIHKGGSRAMPANYRPVALTSHLVKVFERPAPETPASCILTARPN